MTKPVCVITFRYPENELVEVQSVPYLSLTEGEAALRRALETGHDIEAITCYTNSEADANQLFAVMDALAKLPNVRGKRARIFAL